tara:strand:- start:2058 stop:2300 length:243 start_codon:yes stop_codon:yes gene_type:complete
MIVNGLKTEIKQRADGMYNVWQKHALSWYDNDFEEWLRESENTHNPEMWVVIDVLTKEQKELVDFVQQSPTVEFNFTVEN